MQKPTHYTLKGARLFAAGLDWLTLTAPQGSKDARLLADIGCAWLDAEHRAGFEAKESNRQGFFGVKAGKFYFGLSGTHAMLVVSGDKANDILRELKTHGCCPKATRIDAQATAQLKRDRPDEAHTVGNHCKAFAEAKGGNAPRSFSLHKSGDAGYSCSVGTRGKGRFGRCYNKTAEQRGKVEPNLLRFEDEFSRTLAQQVFEAFYHSSDPQALALSICADEWHRRGVRLPFLGDPAPGPRLTTYNPTDNERRIEYLKRSVRPVVSRLEAAGLVGAATAAIYSVKSKSFEEYRRVAALERSQALQSLRTPIDEE